MADSQPGRPPRQRLAPGNVAILLRSALRAMRRSVFRRRPRGGVTATSAADRNAELVAIGMRMGRKGATRRARRTFASAARKEELDRRHMVRTADDVVRALGGMKGVLMKLGQMQSYLNDSLPPEWKDALAKLQSDAPPMAPELAAAVIVDDLGSPPDQLFAEWDPVPIAAASVGQVHRALTRDGRAVAVKVQYPGVAEAVASDLENAGLIFAALAQLFPGLDHRSLVAELRERLVEELDYTAEARHQQEF